MPRAVILGGTGAIGTATARRLLARGWEVQLADRCHSNVPPESVAAGASFASVERDDDGAVRALVGNGADLLVDCVCYTAAHAAGLLPLLSTVTSTVMISSKAVYVDPAGRHANSEFPPHFGGPISEDHPTLRPNGAPFDSRQGYGANKVAAEETLLESGYPVTVVRPSKVHGAWARRPREWVFVRRVLDRRPVVLLAHEGIGVDHTSAAENVSALIDTVAEKPGRRVLNSADPDAPCALEIARTVAAHLGHHWEEVLLADAADHGLGAHPWDAVPPIVLDTSAAGALGYEPVGSYASTVADEIDWMVRTAEVGAQALPWDLRFFESMFDYEREDEYVAR